MKNTDKDVVFTGILTVHEEIADKIEWIGTATIAAAIVGTPGAPKRRLCVALQCCSSDLVTTSRASRCEIELIGKVTRGQSVFSFGSSDQDARMPPNIAVVTEIDAIQLRQVLRNVIV